MSVFVAGVEKNVTKLRLERGLNVRGEVLRCRRVHERFLQFDGHALLGLGAAPWAVTFAIARDSGEGLCLDVTANAESSDSV